MALFDVPRRTRRAIHLSAMAAILLPPSPASNKMLTSPSFECLNETCRHDFVQWRDATTTFLSPLRHFVARSGRCDRIRAVMSLFAVLKGRLDNAQVARSQ
jgi:hypothetical protein